MSRDCVILIDISGRGCYDMTPLSADTRAFAALVNDLLALAQPLSGSCACSGWELNVRRTATMAKQRMRTRIRLR